ncbi:hypothetical protein AURDEDRAFT_112021 [Auricularia subglabra TFB-10046 SS5]|nr:hypothetical protein AURDEDRAFT_112021 [Auricularia subglabra TFB-10046 SS5]
MSWPNKEDRSDYRTTLQYLGRACLAVDCASMESLKACSRCKRAKYCSADCQKRDYPSHKLFCLTYSSLDEPVIDPDARVVRGEDSVGPTPRQDEMESQPYLQTYVHTRMTALLRALGPRVTKIANYLGYLFPRCLWCYAPEPGIVCSDCNIAAWCSTGPCAEKGRTAHEGAHCRICQNIVRDDDFIRTSPAVPSARFCPERLLTSPPPASILSNGWENYLPAISLPDRLQDPAIISTVITRQLSLPLTILAAMQRFGLIDKFATGEHTLRIHLIGAERNYELVAGGLACEELMHVLPGVKTLEWTMVGPSMGRLGDANEATSEVDCCPPCKAHGRRRILGWNNVRYQQYTAQPGYAAPDLAVGFNCGMHEQPQSWGPVLDHLAARRIPAVFTSYSEGEAKADAHVVRKSGIAMRWESERNAWAGLRAQWDFCVEGGAWYENAYWLGFGPTAQGGAQ